MSPDHELRTTPGYAFGYFRWMCLQRPGVKAPYFYLWNSIHCSTPWLPPDAI
jgi:hypothetical protein